jgi:deoxyadenosine/deoxycytidine kinase
MKEKTPLAKHIAVAGNIGAGKTTLTTQLARHFGWEPHYEDVEDNPYLADFYHDMHRWSFNLQVYFLNSRYRQIIDIQTGNKTIIQDRTIYEDAHIFAPNLHEMGLMSKRDFENYFSLFQLMVSQVQPPDLLIYLKASIPTLVDHIQARGRDYEGTISLDYLKKLNERYDNWINSYNHGKLLIINSDEVDFINRQEDLGVIVSKIQAELHGLF